MIGHADITVQVLNEEVGKPMIISRMWVHCNGKEDKKTPGNSCQGSGIDTFSWFHRGERIKY